MQRRQPLKTRPAVTAAALSLPFSPIQSPPAAFLQNLCIQKYPRYTNFEFCNIISLNTQIGFWCIQHNVNLVIAISPPSLGGSCTTAKKERNVDPKILNSKLCRWYCSSSLTNWCCRLWLLAKKSFDPLFTFPIAPSTKQPNSQRKSSSDDVVRFDQIMPTLPIAPSTKPLIS